MLWRRVNRGLSAGRVQSPTVRLIVERERERIAFVSTDYWDIDAITATDPSFDSKLVGVAGAKVATGKDFNDGGQIITPKSGKTPVQLNEARARGLAEGLDGKQFTVRSVEEKPYRSSPKPPFMTSTLQQEGGRKLRLSSSQVMRVAQGLYERGFITYMRTDDVILSEEAMAATRDAVSSEYGSKYLNAAPKQYKKKTQGQDAHEAIRPTTPYRSPDAVSTELNSQELALYRLIWQRTLASQMADAAGVTVSIRLAADSVDRTTGELVDCEFAASGTTITFPGYRAVYVASNSTIFDARVMRDSCCLRLLVSPNPSLTSEMRTFIMMMLIITVMTKNAIVYAVFMPYMSGSKSPRIARRYMRHSSVFMPAPPIPPCFTVRSPASTAASPSLGSDIGSVWKMTPKQPMAMKRRKRKAEEYLTILNSMETMNPKRLFALRYLTE